MATYQLDCPSCYEFSGKSIAELLRHVRFFHADVRPFSIRCNLGCGRERPFTSFLTFRDHVYTWHSGVTVSVGEPPVNFQQPDVLQSYDGDDSSEDDPPPDREPVDYAAKLQQSAARFILEVQEKHRIPQSTMENIIKTVDSLYQVRTILTGGGGGARQ
jgi:hypothetical protein